MQALNKFIKAELEGIFGDCVIRDLKEIIDLYRQYDGSGQDWEVKQNLDYKPSKSRTNIIKKLIKEEARFMFSRSPEIRIEAIDKQKDGEKAEKLNHIINKILKENNFGDKLLKGARDCFIGKRVALKLSADETRVKPLFRPSMEFIFDTDPEDSDRLIKVIFFYQQNDSIDKKDQRIWKQKYWIENGQCYLTEAVYDGHARVIDIIKENEPLNIDFIPVKVIINDGLTGDLIGESDVTEIEENQEAYNHLKSDDLDALKFNMFPIKLGKNLSEATTEKLSIAPNAFVDGQSENEDRDCDLSVVESTFNYETKYLESINRAKNDMYELLNVPNVSLEQLKGLMQSGKSMKALYWNLITRCNEKWTVWHCALEWMIESILKMHKVYVEKSIDLDFDYAINITLLYSLPEDDQAEKQNDLAEVNANVRSKKSYIQKWSIADDADAELEQIAKEQSMFQDAFLGSVNSELENE
jgi:hypothetical protein